MPWRRASFKGKKVWVEVDAAGEAVASGGRIAMRYSDKPGATVYRAGVGRIDGLEGALVELEDGVDADARPTGSAPSSRGSGFGSAGSRTKAQAAAAAEAADALLSALPPDSAVAFTDGGCKGNPGPAGSGVSLRLPDGRRAEAAVALGQGTNNVAELTAVAAALDLLDEASIAADAPVALLTDSQYVHGVLAKGWKAKANRELILPLRARLQARPGVVLHWVAGHVGVAGNERADALAGEGIAGRSFVRWHDA